MTVIRPIINGFRRFSLPLLRAIPPHSSHIFKSFPSTRCLSAQRTPRKIVPSQGSSSMNKVKKIAGKVFFVGLTLAAFSYPSRALATATKPPIRHDLRPVILSPYSGIILVQKCIRQYPEVLWMANGGVKHTQEGIASSKEPYSEQLFGKRFVEFDRTMMTLYCLKLILNGSDTAYELFTKSQPEEVRLTRESFRDLQAQAQKLLKSRFKNLSEEQIAQVMELALILGDMGKSERAREVFKQYGVYAPDHDDFHGEAMRVLEKHPHICSSFFVLPAAAKELLIQSANLAHYGHITHLEGSIEMFDQLVGQKENLDPFMLSFDLFVHTCDVAGALGHVENQSSLVYNEQTHQAMQAMKEAVEIVIGPETSAVDALNCYLEKRAAWLHLDSADPSDRVLTRIGAMLRLFTEKDGQILREAFRELDVEMQERIALELDIREDNPYNLRTPTYMPAVLVNLSNNLSLGESREERLKSAMKIGLPFLAKALMLQKVLVLSEKLIPSIPLCFNEAAGVAKENPHLLSGEFSIDSDGNIHIEPSS